MSNQDIGDELGVGLRTVKGHIEAIFSKTDARSTTEAMLRALKEGWVNLSGRVRQPRPSNLTESEVSRE